MKSSIFFVTIRENYETDRNDFFPYISSHYAKIAKNFQPGRKIPVLAVKDVTLVAEDESVIETSQFLVPTENNNFMWVQSEIFIFAGFEPE